METRKIILDCDPGHDDAVAIMMAAVHPAVELLGITVVAGNQTLEKTVSNALKICQHLNIDVPVYPGCPRPIVAAPRYAGFIHGKSGLDGPVFAPLNRKAEEQHAVNYLIDTLMNSDGDITVVTTGPQTNLAMAMRLQPRICDKIREIVMMGGAIGAGNVTPAAEFNILADPEAARIVFECGRPIVMCGLDVTRKVLCYQSVIDRMNRLNNKAATLFKDMMEFYNSTQKSTFGLDGGPLHDPVTISYLIDPEVLTLKECHVDIEISSEQCNGRTNCDVTGFLGLKENARVALDIDVERYWNIVEDCLSLYGNR